MFAQFDDLDDFLTETPLALAPLARLYEHHTATPNSASPLHAFIYLINYHDQQGLLPYDYVPPENLGYLELDLLGKALVVFADNPIHAIRWLDHFVHLLDEQDLDLMPDLGS